MENRLKKYWLKKYWQIFKISWHNVFVYRFSLIMWRIRSIISTLGIYFFWYAVYRFNQKLGAYDEKMMLTYILIASILSFFVLSSKTYQIAEEIATGKLNNRILKPLNYLKSIIALDLGDKSANLFFVALELMLIFIIFKPPFFLQTNIFFLLEFSLVSFIGLFIYFYLSVLVSFFTFWYPEDYGWPARFLFMVVSQFLSGSYLPLDLLPLKIFQILRLLPSSYFVFFPLQIYLGKVNQTQFWQGFLIMLSWIAVLNFLTRYLWQKGLKNYTGVGI